MSMLLRVIYMIYIFHSSRPDGRWLAFGWQSLHAS